MARPTGAKVGEIYYEVDLETGKMLRQAREVEGATARVERAFTKVASAVASLVAAMSIEAVVRQSINASRAFEKTVADLSAITGATGDSLEKLKNEAKTLASTSTASAGQVVEAMKLIASAKPELLETSGALAAVTKEAIALAEASGLALPAAAEAVTLALNQFGEGADQASRFVNVLAAGAKFGASEIADTAIALKNSAVSAAAAKVSFEETNAALQALAAGGIKGGEAGTALRNVILKLQTESDQKLRPSLNGLAGALENLSKKNLDTAALTKLFGLENVNAAQALIQSAGAVRTLTSQLTGTSTAYEQAATNTSTFDAAVKRMTNALDLAAIKLGDELKPAALAGAEAITKLADAFVQGAPAIKAVGEALTQGLTVLAVLITGRVAAALGLFTLLLVRAVPVIGAATIATKGFGAALALLGGPIGAAVTVLTLLALNWDKITGAAKTAAEISEQSAERIKAALNKGGSAATKDLEEQLAEAKTTLAFLDKEIKAGSVRSIYGDRGPVYGEKRLAQLRAERDQVAAVAASIQTAIQNAYGAGRRPAKEGGGRVNVTDAPPPPRALTDEERKAADERLKGELAQLEGEQRIRDEQDALTQKFYADKETQRQQDVEAEKRASDERLRNYLEEVEGERRIREEQDALSAEFYKRDQERREQEAYDRRAAQEYLLSGIESFFASSTELLRRNEGEQSDSYKAMFALSKGFAIAQGTIALYNAAVQAMADPSALTVTEKLARYAAVFAAGSSLLGTIKGAQYGGGRQYGGPVSAGSMYRVNETGAPEMFVGNGGRQYMMPTTSGQVVPADQVGGGGAVIELRVINQHSGAQVTQRTGSDGRPELVISEVAAQIRDHRGPVWGALAGSTNVRAKL